MGVQNKYEIVAERGKEISITIHSGSPAKKSQLQVLLQAERDLNRTLFSLQDEIFKLRNPEEA